MSNLSTFYPVGTESSGGGLDWSTPALSGDFTAEDGMGYPIDTSGSVVEVQLPVGVAGMTIAVKDYAGTFGSSYCLITPDGTENIQGVNDSLYLDQDNQYITLVYSDTAEGWLIVSASPYTEAELSYPNENLLINGGFNVWQRGTSLSVSNDYGPDRWIIGSQSSTGIESATVWRGYEIGTYPYGRYVVSQGSSSSYRLFIRQKIESENTKTLEPGSEVTLSFWLGYRNIENPATLNVRFDHADAEDDFSSITTDDTQAIFSGVTGSQNVFVKYEVTTTLTTSACANGLQFMIEFITDAGGTVALSSTTPQIRVGGAKLERGGVATDFVSRPYSEEFSLCQRYYELIYRTDLHRLSTNDTAKANIVNFVTPKRANPSITMGTQVSGTISVNASSSKYIRVLSTNASTGNTTTVYNITADAEL